MAYGLSLGQSQWLGLGSNAAIGPIQAVFPNCGIHSSYPWINVQAMVCLNQENAMLCLEAGNMGADQAIAAYRICYFSQAENLTDTT